MDTLKGPLGSHKNYIRWIALDNCQDYFLLVRANEEKGKRDPHKELRYFLNAIESLNNIADYLYYDTYQGDSNKFPTGDDFRKALHKEHPFLGRVADIANAYKHCVRRNPKAVHAKDLVKNEISVQLKLKPGGTPDVAIDYKFEGIDVTDTSIQEAFHFWVDYLNDKHTIDVVELTSKK